jgi:Na+/melibiose symporter-like transporter
VLSSLAWTIMVLLPLSALIVVTAVKEPPDGVVIGRRPTFREGLKLVMRNGPMLRVLMIAVLVWFGEAARSAVSLFFIRDIVGVPTIGAAYFLYFIAGLGAIPFWLWLGRTMGKHRAFICTLVVVSSVSLANLLLSPGDYLAFLALFVIKGFCFGGTQFLPLAMLADVVDVDSARANTSRAGAYFAFLGFSEKLAIAFGTGVSLNIIGLLGFDPSAGMGASTDQGILALRLVYCVGPVVFYAMAMRLVWNYPLTPERHARLRARLARREARLAASIKDAPSGAPRST